MHITNIPLVASSLTFLLPYYTAVSYKNYYSAVAWGSLACTSTLLHTTKRPFHIYGHGNCIPWLYNLDVLALYACIIRSVIDSSHIGLMGYAITSIVVGYAGLLFYGGKESNRFVYDKHLDMSILSHLSTHLISSIGGVCIISLRALS